VREVRHLQVRIFKNIFYTSSVKETLVSEVAYLAKDPVDATREVADLAREVPIPARDSCAK
jgi:hypothetical protein